MEAKLEVIDPPAEEEHVADDTDLSPEEYLGQVVVGLIESGRGKSSTKEIVYALTLENEVSDDLFEDITQGLRGIQAAGAITNKCNGKYRLKGSFTEEAGQPDDMIVRRNGKPPKKPSNKDKKRLEKMMRRELGDPVTPQNGPKRKLNPRRRRSNHPRKKRT